MRVSLRRMLADVLEDQLSIDATLPRTLVAILLRPGRLTNEYLKGRIVSWVPPFRLYLAASVLFFLVLSIQNRVSELRTIVAEPADSTATARDSSDVRSVGEVLDSLAAEIDDVAQRNPTTVAGTPGRQTEGDPEGPTGRPVPEVEGGPIGITLRPDTTGEVPWTERLAIQTGIPALNQLVRSRFEELGGLSAEEIAGRIGTAMLARLPTAMFILLPVFALILKLLYVRSGRYYVEHFVFALHYHAFAFLTFTLMVVLPIRPLPAILGLWLGAYLWIALRRVYGQSAFWTSFKWLSLSWTYIFVLVAGLLVTFVTTVILL